jgi:TatA/E family protein of Tat protein translocase
MNIMGIGTQEMMVIAVIALLVFGPGKLPEVMGQAGKLVRDFRRMSAELSGEFEKTIAEARDATSGLSAELGGMSKEVNSITNSVKKDLGVKNSSTSKSKTTGTKTSSASKSTTSAKSTASKSTSSSTSKIGGKPGASTSKSTTASKSTSTAAKKPPVPVATREDPTADVFLFEPKPVERPKRTRKAVPSVIADRTPRIDEIASSELDSILAASNEAAPEGVPTDAISRARQRRRNAGYARATA